MEVLNKGISGKNSVHVGKGKATLKSLLPNLSTPTPITIDLTLYSKTEDIKKGSVKMLATISDTVPTSPGDATRVIEPVALERIADDAKDEMLSQMFGDVGELVDGTHLTYTIGY
ncbi:hypothetical protein EON65_45730, partial [archaeon]